MVRAPEHRRRPSRGRRAGPAAGALLLVAALGCGPGEGPAPASTEAAPTAAELPLPEGTPVVLVIIDTLRADHLSCYGYELATSPNLDRFAASATLFEANSTQCNSTFPSITSILTGLYPRTHRNYLPVPLPGRTVENEQYASLAERLLDVGYATLAVVSHPTWRGDPGDGAVRRGWERYSVIADAIPIEERPLHAHGAHTNERAFALLDDYERERAGDPLALWVHYFDPHTDLEPHVYNAPEPYRDRFLRAHLEAVGLSHLHDELTARDPQARTLWIQDELQEPERGAALLASGRALYDAEIASCDAELERLFERLRRLGVYDRAVIVVMADHGENLEAEPAGQGRMPFTHQRLYEPVAHTPLLVKLPGQREGRRVAGITQNVDVLPTLIELLGLPAGKPVEGRSLVPLLRDPGTRVHERVFVESSDHVERAVRTETWKLISPPRGAEPMLFPWRSDPGEREDLAAARPELTADLLEALAAFEPRDAYCVRFEPDGTRRAIAFELELAGARIERVRGVEGGELSPDGSRFAFRGTIADAPVELALELERRNTLARLRIQSGHADAWEHVWVGRLPLQQSLAYPLYAPADAPAPADPPLRVALDPDGTLELDVDAPVEGDVRIELRHARHAYGKAFELLPGGAGLGPLTLDRAAHVASARGPARGRFGFDPADGEVLLLVRVDGRWPQPARVDWNGSAVRRDAATFAVPYPLDAELVATLFGGRGRPRPGSVHVWLESAREERSITPEMVGDAATEDALRALGYLDEAPEGAEDDG